MKLCKCQLVLKSFDSVVLQQTTYNIYEAVRHIFYYVRVASLPTNITKTTVIRSPHVYKKSREQFEVRTYKTIISFSTPNKAVSNKFIREFIENFSENLPSGVSFRFILMETR